MGLFPRIIQCVGKSSIGGQKQFMEVATTTSLDPIGTSSIRGFELYKYWLIGAWSESKSPFVDFSSLTTLRLEGLGSVTWGALVLVIICGPTLWLQCNIPNVINYNIGRIDEWVHLYV